MGRSLEGRVEKLEQVTNPARVHVVVWHPSRETREEALARLGAYDAERDTVYVIQLQEW